MLLCECSGVYSFIQCRSVFPASFNILQSAIEISTAMSRQRTTKLEEMQTSFGYAQVEEGRKQGLVDGVFHNVASKYDVMNDLMSAGVHRLWKQAMVNSLNPPSRPARPMHYLDVAGGTGDIAFRIIKRASRKVDVTVLDINASMLAVGRERAMRNGMEGQVEFIEGNAESLPFDDNTFDGYTIAFGIRNVPRMDLALSEAFRVLRPGGKFICLEFSDVELPLLDRFYELWSMQVIPQLGGLVAGDQESYRYLVESIRKFPDQQKFANAISAAGFSRVTWQNMTGGVVALHSGWKL